METCVLCERSMPNTDVFSVSNLGKKTFECKDEDVCLDVATQARKEKAIKAKAMRSSAFREKFGVNIEDLSIEHSPAQATGLITLFVAQGDLSTLITGLSGRDWEVHP